MPSLRLITAGEKSEPSPTGWGSYLKRHLEGVRMEFICLHVALTSMADCVHLEPHFDDKVTAIGAISKTAADKFWKGNNPKIERARQFGVAAFTLNKALHDSDAPPRWMAFDEGKRFAVRTDAAKQEGIELLTHATGWGNRALNNCSSHFRNAITQGDDALFMPLSPDANDGITPNGQLLRLIYIGFDRSELLTFLDGRISHNLIPQATTPSPVIVDVETTEQRRARLLNSLEAEEKNSKRGALQKVYELELLTNPKADRSYMGKQIKRAKQEKANTKQGGATFRQLVQDGKRIN